MPLVAFFALFGLLQTPAVAAESSVSIRGFLVDPSGTLTLDDIRAIDDDFMPMDSTSVHLGYSRANHWFRVEIQGGDTNGWMALELSNPRLGEVTLYSPDREGGYRSASVGVRKPFWSREMPGLTPAFPVRVAANQTRTLYLCVKNYGSLRFDLRLWTLSAHNRHANYVLAGALLVAGALIVLGLYNLCIFLHLRQMGYFWIALFLLSCALWQMAGSGTANMFLWPNSTVWSRHALFMTAMLTLFIGTCMSNVLLDTRRYAPRIGWANIAMGLITLIATLLSFFNNTIALYVALAAGLVIPFSMAGLAIYTIRKGSGAGKSFLISWGLVLVGCIVTTLVGPGYIPASTYTLHFMDVALLGAGLSWSFALTGRLKVHESEQRKILEVLVKARTSELKSALDAVKTLHGLLPICSCCKKIRDDQGYWQHVETYLQEHTEADFSHGICPECAHTHYPEYFPRRDGRVVHRKKVLIDQAKGEPLDAPVVE
jgi:hypothetical protein